jgi:hypothetical protein
VGGRTTGGVLMGGVTRVAVASAATIAALGIMAGPASAATPIVTSQGVATATSGAIEDPEILVGVIAQLDALAVGNPDIKPGYGVETVIRIR